MILFSGSDPTWREEVLIPTPAPTQQRSGPRRAPTMLFSVAVLVTAVFGYAFTASRMNFAATSSGMAEPHLVSDLRSRSAFALIENDDESVWQSALASLG